MRKGLIHIYCGDGKGKTSAAIGLAVRAAGSGMKVLFARFLKNEQSGELKILDWIPEIEVLHLERSYGFFRTLTDQEKEEVRINRGGAFCDCGLKVFRKIAGHTLTDKELEKLLKRKKLTGISDFKSNEGKDFPADIILNGNEIKLVYPKKKAG